MGLFSNFFGGDKSKTTPKQLPTMTPEQKTLMDTYLGQAQAGAGGPAPSSPTGAVPQTGQEDTYFNWVNNLSKQKSIQNILSGTPGYEVGPEAANRLYEESIRPGYMREFNETVLPTLKNAYTGPGYYGSARMGAEAKAGGDLAYQLAAKKAELDYGEEIAKRKSIDAAYERVIPGTEAMTGVYGQAGLYSRNIEHEKVSDDLRKFLMGESVNGQYNPAYNPQVQMGLQLLGLKSFGWGSETESEGAGIGNQFLSSFARGMGQGLGEMGGGKLWSPLAGGGGTAPAGSSMASGSSWTGPTAGFEGWGGADYLAGGGGAMATTGTPYWAALMAMY